MATSIEIKEFLETVKHKTVGENLISEKLCKGSDRYVKNYYFWEFGIVVGDKLESHYIQEDYLKDGLFTIHQDDGSHIIEEYERLMEEIEEAETEEEIAELRNEAIGYISNLTEKEKEFILMASENNDDLNEDD